ncbi:protein BIG GRAIN 1-like [Tasmannia lanceolata]|uniref:protein BIG GRAIN 1-like n=1 Tax=Tasmannia lanceolata TaxID=3420 RepID=UPI0040637B3A
MHRWEKTLREERSLHERKNPSFSSTLLDVIYRSIDKGNEGKLEELILYRETMRKKQSTEEEDDNEKVLIPRKKQWDFEDRLKKSQRDHTWMLYNFDSSSSDSSYGRFSSSETESVYRLKPVRTVPPVRPGLSQHRKSRISEIHTSSSLPNERNIPSPQKTKQEGFIKSKSSDLNKTKKQPISPGGRISGFLSSIFAAGNGKKTKISATVGGHMDDFRLEMKSNSAQASTCSSVSSYSRSCLSKNPTSKGKSVNGVKRSVRFYSDEEERKMTAFNEVRKIGESGFIVGEKNRNVQMMMRENKEADVEDEDGESCSSSDLFELENFAERYREELPVYETTRLDMNQAIAKGFGSVKF